MFNLLLNLIVFKFNFFKQEFLENSRKSVKKKKMVLIYSIQLEYPPDDLLLKLGNKQPFTQI